MYEIFEKLLHDRGLKMIDVSRATGISHRSLSDWKKGRYNLKQDKLQKIADFFDVSVDYLMTGKEIESYYLNDKTKQMAQAIFEDKELRALFSAAKDSSPEDLKLAHDMLLRLKNTEQGNEM